MFLRATKRIKDGKEHRYFSVVERVRHPGSKHPVQKPVLYLGELNDSQQAAWAKALLVAAAATHQIQPLRLFPDDRTPPPDPVPAVQVRWQEYELSHPRGYGAIWLATELWRQLGLDTFWTGKLGWTREGTDWAKTLLVSVAYRLIAPGSEWQCWRLWYERTALGDLLGPDFHLGNKDQLYAVLDRLLPHRAELFQHLRARWQDLFGVKYEVLLYDLTSTYFEGAAQEIPKATHGYSRDHRPDCRQVVLALVVTPEGLPLAYEVMPGNRAAFRFSVQQDKLADAELYDGHYLLRSNLTAQEPAWLWKLYLLLVEIEGVFRTFKNDLHVRPIYHSLEARVEAHIFVSFLAYCLWVTLKQRLTALAPGLTPRQALDQLASVQMLDVVMPTTDGRTLVLSRYTQPDAGVRLLLQRLQLALPEQPPPRLSAARQLDPPPARCSEDLSGSAPGK